MPRLSRRQLRLSGGNRGSPEATAERGGQPANPWLSATSGGPHRSSRPFMCFVWEIKVGTITFDCANETPLTGKVVAVCPGICQPASRRSHNRPVHKFAPAIVRREGCHAIPLRECMIRKCDSSRGNRLRADIIASITVLSGLGAVERVADGFCGPGDRSCAGTSAAGGGP